MAVYSQLPTLIAGGVLTEQAAAALRAHYGAPKENRTAAVSGTSPDIKRPANRQFAGISKLRSA